MTLLILNILQLIGTIFLVMCVCAFINEIAILRADTSSSLDILTKRNAEEVAKILIEKGYVINTEKTFTKDSAEEIVNG